MEQKDKKIKKSYWLTFSVIQTIMSMGVGIWAITHKVEADKQRTLALSAEEEAVMAQKEAEKFKKLYEGLVEETK